MTSLSEGGGHLPASQFEKMQMDAGDVVVPDLLSCLTKFSTRRVDSRRSLSPLCRVNAFELPTGSIVSSVQPRLYRGDRGIMPISYVIPRRVRGQGSYPAFTAALPALEHLSFGPKRAKDRLSEIRRSIIRG